MLQRALSRNLQVTLLAAACAFGQDFGTHNLPAEFAEPGAKVLGVMNKTPNASRNLGYSEGPVGDAEGSLYFTEDNPGNAGTGNIWKVTAGGQSSNFYTGSGLPNGLEFDNAGKMISAEKGAIAQYDVKIGSSSRIQLAMDSALNPAWRNNDVSVGSNGGVWFTNHGNGNQFFYRSPAGKLKTYHNVAPLGVGVPNGIEWIEEKKTLLVCSDGSKQVYKYDVKDDGSISNKTEFGAVAEPDGLTVDDKGNVYVASYNDGAIVVFGPEGKKEIGRITLKIPSGNFNASNCVFGGVDGKTLFITGTGGAYKIQMKNAGRVRPGSVGVRPFRAGLSLTPSRPSLVGFGLDGRKVAVRRPAAILLFPSAL